MFFHSLILLLPISCVSTSQLVPKKICDKKRVPIPYSSSSLPNIFRSPCSVKLGNIPPSHLDFSKLHDDNETSEEEEEASDSLEPDSVISLSEGINEMKFCYLTSVKNFSSDIASLSPSLTESIDKLSAYLLRIDKVHDDIEDFCDEASALLQNSLSTSLRPRTKEFNDILLEIENDLEFKTKSLYTFPTFGIIAISEAMFYALNLHILHIISPNLYISVDVLGFFIAPNTITQIKAIHPDGIFYHNIIFRAILILPNHLCPHSSAIVNPSLIRKKSIIGIRLIIINNFFENFLEIFYTDRLKNLVSMVTCFNNKLIPLIDMFKCNAFFDVDWIALLNQIVKLKIPSNRMIERSIILYYVFAPFLIKKGHTNHVIVSGSKDFKTWSLEFLLEYFYNNRYGNTTFTSDLDLFLYRELGKIILEDISSLYLIFEKVKKEEFVFPIVEKLISLPPLVKFHFIKYFIDLIPRRHFNQIIFDLMIKSPCGINLRTNLFIFKRLFNDEQCELIRKDVLYMYSSIYERIVKNNCNRTSMILVVGDKISYKSSPSKFEDLLLHNFIHKIVDISDLEKRKYFPNFIDVQNNFFRHIGQNYRMQSIYSRREFTEFYCKMLFFLSDSNDSEKKGEPFINDNWSLLTTRRPFSKFFDIISKNYLITHDIITCLSLEVFIYNLYLYSRMYTIDGRRNYYFNEIMTQVINHRESIGKPKIYLSDIFLVKYDPSKIFSPGNCYAMFLLKKNRELTPSNSNESLISFVESETEIIIKVNELIWSSNEDSNIKYEFSDYRLLITGLAVINFGIPLPAALIDSDINEAPHISCLALHLEIIIMRYALRIKPNIVKKFSIFIIDDPSEFEYLQIIEKKK